MVRLKLPAKRWSASPKAWLWRIVLLTGPNQHHSLQIMMSLKHLLTLLGTSLVCFGSLHCSYEGPREGGTTEEMPGSNTHPVWQTTEQHIPLSEIPLAEAPLGLLVDEPSRSLEEIGVESGDLITELNGISVTSPRSVRSAFLSTHFHNDLEVEVRRNETTLSLHSPIHVFDHIDRVSPTSYQITQTLIERMLDDPQATARHQPELQQAYEDGAPSGVRLTAIPVGSFWTSIGVRQNDVLVDVNGQPLTTPQRFIEIWEAFEAGGEVQLNILRRGRERVLTYQIVE